LHPPKPSPAHIEARLTAPPRLHTKPSSVRRARPTLAAAMPAKNKFVHPIIKPVHLGDTFGVTPNRNAMRPANVAALGNPYGDMRGPAVAPRGVVKSAGFGDSSRFGAGGGGGVASGRVGSVGLPGYTPVSAGPVVASSEPQATSVEVISKPPVQYPIEARQLRIEGNVVLSVTFSASGQVLVHGVLRGLGHGLDQEAVRVAQQIRFRPATVHGRPVDTTTRVTIAFQLA
jgi:TonB family protein